MRIKMKQKNLIYKIKFDLKNVVKKRKEKGSFSHQEAKFLLSKIQSHIFTSVGNFLEIGQ